MCPTSTLCEQHLPYSFNIFGSQHQILTQVAKFSVNMVMEFNGESYMLEMSNDNMILEPL